MKTFEQKVCEIIKNKDDTNEFKMVQLLVVIWVYAYTETKDEKLRFVMDAIINWLDSIKIKV